MADSQVPFKYDAAILTSIRAVVSTPRLESYMRQSGFDLQYAAALYLYNARVAKAFLFPLHMAEVVIRNAIDDVLCRLFGLDWHVNSAFRGVLMPGGQETLDKAIDRVSSDKGRRFSRGQIVAALTFDFWSNLFRDEYDRPIWQANLHAMLPNLPKELTRPDVQSLVRDINKFRNRVAHHEPLLGVDFTLTHKKIIDLINYRDGNAADWIRHHSTVGAALRSKPAKSGFVGPTLREVCDPKPVSKDGSASLVDLLARAGSETSVIARIDKSGGLDAVLPVGAVLAFIADRAAATGGMIDLNEHTLDDVISFSGALWAEASSSEPVSKLPQIMKGAVKAVLVCDHDKERKVVGVIAKSHRRY